MDFGFYKGKKVLVTGHTGFKGSWLSKWLLDLGAEVTGLSLYVPSTPSHYDALDLSQAMTSLEGDIRNIDDVKNAIKKSNPDVIFHLAAQPIVSHSVKDPITSFQTNVIGTCNILEAVKCSNNVGSVVFVTSDKCYENREWHFGYRENDQLGGKDPYSASKACAEIAISSFFRTYFQSSSDLPFIATGRAGNVVGGGDWASDRIVPDCIRSWTQGKELVIRSPGATRPWQHVLEPLSGYLRLGELLFKRSGNINGESFNFGPKPETIKSVSDLLEELALTFNGTWKVAQSELSGKEAGLLKLNCDKSAALLKWSPKLDFKQTIHMTSLWYESYYRDPKLQPITSQQINEYQNLWLNHHDS